MADMSNKRFFWHDSRLRAHFLINVAIGILIAMAFALTTSSQWGEGMMNAAFDLLVRHEYNNASDSAQKGNPLYFVEITPAEHRQWGEPLLTPRDRLADLIEAAWKKGAPVVALDILLDRPDRDNPTGDMKLRSLLEKMLRENSRTQVIFPVRIGTDGGLRPHLFDDLFKRTTTDGKRIFYPAVPTVLASEGDLLNRFWGLYQVGRDQTGHTKVVWSVSLLAAALFSGTQSHLDDAAKTLEGATNHSADGGHAAGSHISLERNELHIPALERLNLPGSDHPVYVEGESHGLPYTQRIRFLIPSETRAKRDAGNFRPGLSPDSLSGRIVVIGNGSPETGDILPTPVGRMPGMYVIGNAINTIVTGRMPIHLNPWLHYAVEALIIVIAAWLFLHFHSLLAQLLSSLIFIAMFVPLSWYIYREWGLFFNFIIPVVGMKLHKTADGIESMIAARGRKNHHHH